MTITRFCLVRHGETDWNAARRLQGHTDIDLNARGLAQAGQMARALKNMELQFDVLYTSDLQRAAKTAQAIEDVFETSAIPNAGLRERHLGALQGLTTDEARYVSQNFGNLISAEILKRAYTMEKAFNNLQIELKLRLWKSAKNIQAKLFYW